MAGSNFNRQPGFMNNHFSQFSTIQGVLGSTLESDDVSCDVRHTSVGRYDSGFDSFRSDSGVFNSESHGILSIAEKLKQMELSCNDASYKLPKMQGQGLSNCFNPSSSVLSSNSFQTTSNHAEQQQQQTMSEISSANFYRHHQNPMTTFRLEDLFRQDEDGDTQLHLSIIKSDFSNTLRLLETATGEFSNCLDIQNDHMYTALHLAVITDQPEVVRALVISGASLLTRDRQGNTALHLACKQSQRQCIEKLTTPPTREEQQYILNECFRKSLPPRTMTYMKSNDINLLNYEGETCLHVAFSSADKCRIEILNYLLNTCGGDVNAQEGKCGYTLLHEAVKSRNCEIVEFLVSQSNLNVNRMCYSGCTALDIALTLQHPQNIINILLRSGAMATTSIETADQESDFDDLMIGGSYAK